MLWVNGGIFKQREFYSDNHIPCNHVLNIVINKDLMPQHHVYFDGKK